MNATGAITKKTQVFARCVLADSYDALGDLCDANVRGVFSTAGDFAGVEELAHCLRYPGPPVTGRKVNLESVIIHVSNDRAQESFHLFKTLVQQSKERFDYAQDGGSFVLTWQFEDGDWFITHVMYDLNWTEGNTAWFSSWRQIDFTVPVVYKRTIDCLRDGVHNNIYVSDEASDEQDLRELVYLYGTTIDTEDYDIFRRKTTSDLFIWDDYHKKGYRGADAWIGAMHPINLREPTNNHVLRFRDMAIEGDSATVHFSRIQPDRPQTFEITADTWKDDIFSLDYDMVCRRDGGEWKIQKVQAHMHLYREPTAGMVFES